jgi:hypothetical protein
MVRLIALCAGAAVAGGLFAWVLYTLLGGGSDDGGGLPVDDRTQDILAFVPLQVERLGRDPIEVYGNLDMRVQAQCSEEEWQAVMADQPLLPPFREVTNIEYHDDGTADVTFTVIGGGGDREVTWALTFIANGLPKLWEIPGSEECTPASL